MDAVELKELMESWARQEIICQQAQATRDNMEKAIRNAVGELDKTVYSEHVVVFKRPGRKTWDWEQAVYDAHVPVERITPHSTIKTNFRRVCEAEGIEKESVSFTEGDPKIIIELSLSEAERADALPVNDPSSNKMFK